MFESFDVTYADTITLDELNRLGIVDGELERLFYGDYRVIYPHNDGGFVVGYTGVKMLRVVFAIDYPESRIIVEEIYIANGQEINTLYCGPTCR